MTGNFIVLLIKQNESSATSPPRSGNHFELDLGGWAETHSDDLFCSQKCKQNKPGGRGAGGRVCKAGAPRGA